MVNRSNRLIIKQYAYAQLNLKFYAAGAALIRQKISPIYEATCVSEDAADDKWTSQHRV